MEKESKKLFFYFPFFYASKKPFFDFAYLSSKRPQVFGRKLYRFEEKSMRRFSLLLVIVVFSTVFTLAQNAKITEGSLYATGKKGAPLGACPLKTTSVKADISGFLTRVTVAQEFENNFSEPIEAFYTFPLSNNSAVDEMTMRIGERTIRGRVLKREEAEKVYEAARAQGKTASLLNQERPNIFTQAVANIMPGEKIVIEISYVETLKYEDGVYEFVFPMTVGPRYIPNSVTDASKISPPIAKTRAGHDVSIEINLDAGVPIEEIRSNSHEITTTNAIAKGEQT
jgi:Ca-activated chloride channel family protein